MKHPQSRGGRRHDRHSPDPEQIAIAALAFLVADDDRIGRFLAITGIDAADIRTAAASDGFLLGVLDHLLDHDELLPAFADQVGIAPQSIAWARDALAGRSDG